MPDGTLINVCVHKSDGCRFCYAEGIVRRWWNKAWGEFPGYTAALLKLGTPVLVQEELDAVLNLSSRILEGKADPEINRIFWHDMTDEYLEFWPAEFIDKCFAVRALTPNLIHQTLTKRADRLLSYMRNVEREALWMNATAEVIKGYMTGLRCSRRTDWSILQSREPWLPLSNVHVGVSAEDQKTADERIPLLLQTPAAVRWISAEPLLGPIDLEADWLPPIKGKDGENLFRESQGLRTTLDWAVFGFESGPKQRQGDLDWIRKPLAQCRAAGVKAFVKQLGARPIDWRHDEPEVPAYEYSLTKKGSDVNEWPEDLRVREYPTNAISS